MWLLGRALLGDRKGECWEGGGGWGVRCRCMGLGERRNRGWGNGLGRGGGDGGLTGGLGGGLVWSCLMDQIGRVIAYVKMICLFEDWYIIEALGDTISKMHFYVVEAKR